MSAYKEMERRNKNMVAKALAEMTPARRAMLDAAFSQMNNDLGAVQPEMRMMSFGGDYNFDVNRTQVELNGEFSKDDLLRIAMVME